MGLGSGIWVSSHLGSRSCEKSHLLSSSTENHFDMPSTGTWNWDLGFDTHLSGTWNWDLEVGLGNFDMNNGQRLLSKVPTVRNAL